LSLGVPVSGTVPLVINSQSSFSEFSNFFTSVLHTQRDFGADMFVIEEE
jgi:hypothetical protein